MLKGFKEFIARGNAIDLAVGVVIGVAFGAVVDAVVTGIINPIVGLVLPGDVKDLAAKTLGIGDAVLAWGLVISQLITFVITAAAVYFIVVVPMNAWRDRGTSPRTRSPTRSGWSSCWSRSRPSDPGRRGRSRRVVQAAATRTSASNNSSSRPTRSFAV